MREGTEVLDLASFLEEERGRMDRALSRAVAQAAPALPHGLLSPIERGVLAGGKRLRPILCVSAYRASAGARGGGGAKAPEAMYDLAVALELIHAYSLMHDDLPCMDDAELRRGEPTVHVLCGERETMVAGAALIPVAALQAWRAAGDLGLDRKASEEAVRVLTRAAGGAGMVGGQALDLLGEGARLSRIELDELHRRKTGALLEGSLVLGAVAARADESIRKGLSTFGREIGLAFQITDDLLDATGDAATLGKNPSDELMRKSTYVSLLGVEGARDEAHARSRAATEALRVAGIRAPALEALAGFVVSRDR